MKFSLLLFISLLPLLSFSQQLKFKIDSTSGDTTFYVDQFYLVGKKGPISDYRPSLSFVIARYKNSVSLYCFGAYKKQIVTILDAGDSISFRLMSGKTVSLIYKKTQITNYPNIKTKVSYFIQSANLSTENIIELTSEPVLFVRVRSEDVNFDYEVDDGKQDELMKSLSLFK